MLLCISAHLKILNPEKSAERTSA